MEPINSPLSTDCVSTRSSRKYATMIVHKLLPMEPNDSPLSADYVSTRSLRKPQTWRRSRIPGARTSDRPSLEATGNALRSDWMSVRHYIHVALIATLRTTHTRKWGYRGSG